jgi:uncharacterized membrane protein
MRLETIFPLLVALVVAVFLLALIMGVIVWIGLQSDEK